MSKAKKRSKKSKNKKHAKNRMKKVEQVKKLYASPGLLQRAQDYATQKELGQCFLVSDLVLQEAIFGADLDHEEDIVIEIGPGIGFLTELLVDDAAEVYAVELDSNTIPHLEALKADYDNFNFLRKDFLQTKIDELIPEEKLADIKAGRRPKIKVVANIPYQISSMIISYLLGEIGEASEYNEYISDILIMVQKEYAQRLMAKQGTKAFGAISMLAQYWSDISLVVEVPRECFHPSPKVDSSFIHLALKSEEDLDVIDNPREFRRLVRNIFTNRRKKLANALKAANYYDEAKIEALSLGDLRGENLTVAELNELVAKLN